MTTMMVPDCPYLCALCGAPCNVIVTAASSQPRPKPLPSVDRHDHHHHHQQFKPHPQQLPQHPQQKQQQQKPKQQQPPRSRQQKRPCVCGGCRAMHYCCDAHRSRHAALPGGHSTEECARMAGQVLRAAELADFPFPWFRSISCVPPPPPPPPPLHSFDPPTQESQPTDPRVDRTSVVPPAPPALSSSLCSLLRSLEHRAPDAPRVAALGPSAGGVELSEMQAAAPEEWAPSRGPDAAATTVVVTPSAGAGLDNVEPGASPSPARSDGGGGSCSGLAEGRRGEGRGGTGGSCTAPGCWRRICGCSGAGGGPQGADATAFGSEDGDWGALQPPRLADVRLAQLQGGPRLKGGRTGGGAGAGAGSAVQAAWSVDPPGFGATESHTPHRVAAAARLQHTPAAIAGLEAAAAATAGGELGKDGAAAGAAAAAVPEALWDQAAWAGRVWHLPPHLAPPLRGPGGDDPGDGRALEDIIDGGGGDAGGGGGAGGDGAGEPRSGCSVLDWLSYYRWAGLPLESPAALLLHFPMTLYGALRLVDERLGGALLRRSRRPPPPAAAAATAAAAASDLGQGPPAAAADWSGPAAVEAAVRGNSPSNGHGWAALCTVLDDPRRLEPGREEGEEQGEEGGGGSSPPAAKRRRTDSSPCGFQNSAEAEEETEAAAARWRVDVLYLGPQSELDQLDTFACLLPLLPPCCTLRLHMVGPDVPDHMHGTVLVYDGGALLGGAGREPPRGAAGGGGGGGSSPEVRPADESSLAATATATAGAAPGCRLPSSGMGGEACRGGDGDGGGGAGGEGASVGGGGGVAAPGGGGDAATSGGLQLRLPPPVPPPPPPRLEVVLHSCLLHEAAEDLGLLLDEEEEDAVDLGFGFDGGVGGGGGGLGPAVSGGGAVSDAERRLDGRGSDTCGGRGGPRQGPPGRRGMEVERVAPPSGGGSLQQQQQQQQSAPLLVFAPNAGLPVYMSWLPTLELLLPQKQQRPVGHDAPHDHEEEEEQGRPFLFPNNESGRPTGRPLQQRPVGHDVVQEGPGRGRRAVVATGEAAATESAAAAAGATEAVAAGQGAAAKSPAAAVPVESTTTLATAAAAAATTTTTESASPGPAGGSEGGPWCSRDPGGGRRRLRRSPLACIFTAYNEEECVRSCQLLEQLYGVRPDVRPAVNPFRQPLWCVARVGNGLPSYSNGFIYGGMACGAGMREHEGAGGREGGREGNRKRSGTREPGPGGGREGPAQQR
ncbi:hypothetical protein PLESTF_000956600 [Pleodorina starrii]|nr:hypothetical protein PLESTF_000956600 [Pleodorina starrii]